MLLLFLFTLLLLLLLIIKPEIVAEIKPKHDSLEEQQMGPNNSLYLDCKFNSNSCFDRLNGLLVYKQFNMNMTFVNLNIFSLISCVKFLILVSPIPDQYCFSGIQS